MLSIEDNELLTRVGRGTPMGEVLRRYWVPSLLSEEIAEPDGEPVQVRILGETLLAFRNTDGEVGLIEERCPHRGASLSYARNEQNGLRCIYHGWKFDITGACVDMPTEPAESTYMSKVLARGYPVREVAGIVWAYLGPPDKMPPFPEFNWLSLWPSRSKEFKILEECNYAQAVEGGIDTAHTSFLHRRTPWTAEDKSILVGDLAPRLDIEMTNYGFRYAAIRTVADGTQYIRITPYILPWYTIVPRDEGSQGVMNAWVPRDDYSTWHFQHLYNLEGEIDVPRRVKDGGVWLENGYSKVRNAGNKHLQTQERIKNGNFSGIEGIVTQDHAVNESQGAITSRELEHLGTSDVAVIAMRQMLLDAARGFQEGQDPPGLDPSIQHDTIRSETFMVPDGADWKDTSPLQEHAKPVEASR